MAHDISACEETHSSDSTLDGESSNSKAENAKVKEVVAGIIHYKGQHSSPFTIDPVPKPLWEAKPEAYTPSLISIGPLHRHEKQLKRMEPRKLRLAKRFLLQCNIDDSTDNYVRGLKKLEENTRGFYLEEIPLEKHEFVKMMIVDGCFLLELIRNWQKDPGDPMFNDTWLPHIARDLILVENQFPFSVLEDLYSLFVKDSKHHPHTIYEDAQFFLQNFVLLRPKAEGFHAPNPKPYHLLAYAQHLFVRPPQSASSPGGSSPGNPLPPSYAAGSSPENPLPPSYAVGSSPENPHPEKPKNENEQSSKEEEEKKLKFKNFCATEVRMAAAVGFKKSEEASLADIRFREGKLEIPGIKINDSTESTLRNMIAFEQSPKRIDMAKYVTSYAFIMNNLIKSAEDVKLLQKKGIFNDAEMSPEDIATMFKDLTKNVTDPFDLSYDQVFKDLKDYCDKPWHGIEGFIHRIEGFILKRIQSSIAKYFEHQWTITGVLAGTILLGLTIAQTIAA